MNQLTICMIIFVLIIIGYMAGKFTMATTALLGMLLMVVTGCLSGETGRGKRNSLISSGK